MTPAEIATVVERLAYRSWPAEEEETRAGWTLRHSPGIRSRRINCGTSPIDNLGDPNEAEAQIRRWFTSRHAAPLVRILSVSPPAIDRHFATSGWVRESPTVVMAAVLEDVAGDDVVRLAPVPDRPWADAKRRLTGMTDRMIATWLRRASEIRGRAGYASIERDGCVVTIGQGVVDDGWLGLFDLNTDPGYRRQGLAAAVVAHLEAWSRTHGATRAYLQVEAQNEPARRLYEQRSYAEVYRYWYRRPGT